MSNADELRTLDVRIATALFGWQAPLIPHPTQPLARYSTNWNAIPLLLEQCKKRGWGIDQQYISTAASEPWDVRLEFDDGGDEYNACDAEADTLQLALCRAIVAVLDALEEVAEETKARES